ncbi:response regulator transcription factor [Heliorestis acidaminivorans]|uniref:Stage 0 sporulation protein A homolog n=1 Tax=Heliorestis acidaminivorans TaxID=553427 RepID=A0A6I0EZW2_9FIRM|nr:response regulator transcription factor [Heliorestis acidaminivorans]KAB2951518.1 response regulator transcription factor [Heliorestis acidaminivorans]
MTSKSFVLQEKVQGLDIGADDYLTKPFAIQELVARIRVALRKQKSSSLHREPELRVKDLVLYPQRYHVQIYKETIHLTKKEYDLLEYLVRNKQVVLSRERILQEVWGYDYIGDSNVVDVYVRYLRSKLDEQFGQKYIHTVRGVGYVVKD